MIANHRHRLAKDRSVIAAPHPGQLSDFTCGVPGGLGPLALMTILRISANS